MLISNIGSVYLERVNPTGNIVFNSSANSGPEKTGLLDKTWCSGPPSSGLATTAAPTASPFGWPVPGNKGFEFQRDLFSHIPQYLKKKPTTRNGR